jgi:membrane protease YdiL (CAAX protease family)
MRFGPGSYLYAAKHPWTCTLFVLPLLAVYEAGVTFLAPAEPEIVRNGADVWLRWTLAQIGLSQQFWPPAMLASCLLLWTWLAWRTRPTELLPTWIGMIVESAVLAIALWGVSRGLRPLFHHLGLLLSMGGQSGHALAQTICFLGAGIYEEALFRLALFSILLWIFQQSELTPVQAKLLAAVVSALLFAVAHNVGPQGETFVGAVFVFRSLAGLYFCCLFEMRGFGIAVGAHAAYDVLVGVVMPSF